MKLGLLISNFPQSHIITITNMLHSQIRIEFKLNDVENEEIYKLTKSPAHHKKQFSCAIAVQFTNSYELTKWTEPFVLLGSESKNGLGSK